MQFVCQSSNWEDDKGSHDDSKDIQPPKINQETDGEANRSQANRPQFKVHSAEDRDTAQDKSRDGSIDGHETEEANQVDDHANQHKDDVQTTHGNGRCSHIAKLEKELAPAGTLSFFCVGVRSLHGVLFWFGYCRVINVNTFRSAPFALFAMKGKAESRNGASVVGMVRLCCRP